MRTLRQRLARQDAITDVVDVLLKTCDDQTLAALMNATLSSESNEDLSDDQADVGERVFDLLTAHRSDLIELAQKG